MQTVKLSLLWPINIESIGITKTNKIMLALKQIFSLQLHCNDFKTQIFLPAFTKSLV